MQAVYALFGWLPVSLQALFAAIVALFLVLLVLKITALIMDCIPFL